ncbi:hypothetical protein PTSG_06475 [Salpingoeca rosetta]|uniref:Uncharacterized protein n=1 Tax=Salpingoeca rosetta (strain ATCC 50818 / BSB-021) TaxID=946362 RepID=F2UFX2_SALR5|nr:uncharacterized protein PTSG_06475 [Salpingoeca rosetta]EGD75400.1 hypothetical protein PTSG_06475 [Salpingoeca rosetta]|eukprot:XP_004991857.1 hypothetical protein PTSG_06475 [Salpingoeca rosetta]
MSSHACWHKLQKLSGGLAKLEDAGARVVPLGACSWGDAELFGSFIVRVSASFMWEAARWYMITVVLISGKDVAQLLLGVGENKSVVIMLMLADCGHGAGAHNPDHLLRHAPLPALLVLGISNLSGWTSFQLLLLNDDTLSANGLAAHWWCSLLRAPLVISMVLSLLFGLTSDCADIELQLLRG